MEKIILTFVPRNSKQDPHNFKYELLMEKFTSSEMSQILGGSSTSDGRKTPVIIVVINGKKYILYSNGTLEVKDDQAA